MEDPSARDFAGPSQFSLKGRPGAVALEAEGLHHPGSSRSGRLVYTPYADVTHLAASQRALWLGTKRSVYLMSRRAFVDEQAPEHIVRALLERIAERPGGAAQLARMAEIEETARLPGEPRATRALVAICAAVYALQLFGGPAVHAVGHFHPALFADGDWWRIVTGNLLHAFSIHLLLNLLAVLALGTLVERALGTARTVVVMVGSGLGAMALSGVASDVAVVGVSGVASGLFGALAWLELRFAAALPAWWRVPRRTLLWVFGATALLSLLPFVAGAAHGGGFVAGLALAAGLSWDTLRSRPSPQRLRAVAGAGVALCAVAGLAAALEASREDYLVSYFARVAALEGFGAEALNNLAWELAVDDEASPQQLETARTLAERAVEESEGRTPEFLDTLAEVHFRLGDSATALELIDEAIRLAPGRRYYREQRRRFRGEREGGPPTEFLPDLLPDWGEPEPEPEGGIQV